MEPELDAWLPDPAVRIAHEQSSSASVEELWAAAREVRLADTRLLGRLIGWRIPGVRLESSFDELFRSPPFIVLEQDEHSLVSGLVGRIWTLRRDYPQLSAPQEFLSWSRPGTARVVFGSWVAATGPGGSVLGSETRVAVTGRQGRIGLSALRPVISAFHPLVASEGMAAAIRRAERPRS